MELRSATEVKYLKGVGPQRAAVLASRGIHSVGDLLGYLPFRYEDRIHFSKIGEIVPGETYTMQGVVADAGLARYSRGRGAIYHLLVRDETGTLPCKFFHGAIPRRTLSPGTAPGDPRQSRGRSLPARPHRNDQSAVRVARREDTVDSTEVGRIVPIYEAIGGISSRMIRRMIHAALASLAAPASDPLPAELLARYGFPTRADALRFVHFPPPDVPIETLNAFRSPAHQRFIFEEFFFYQLSLALRRQQAQQQTGIAFRVREPRMREASSAFFPLSPPRRRSACSRKSPPISSGPGR